VWTCKPKDILHRKDKFHAGLSFTPVYQQSFLNLIHVDEDMQYASLLLVNANVTTLNPAEPKARAVAVKGGEILDVGTTKHMLKCATKETLMLNLDGKTVVPGFIDSHVHMLGFERSLRQLDLRTVSSIKELQSKLKKYEKEHPRSEWILGRGWDQEKFREKRYPSRWDLDAAVISKPVLLTRVCGHVGVANTRALKIAGINGKTEVSTGEIDLDNETKEPTGILREKTLDLVLRVIPKPSFDQIKEYCFHACQEAVKAGLTAVNWLVTSTDEIRAIQRLRSEGRLPLRVYLGLPVMFLDHLVELGLSTGFGDDMVRLGFVKILVDGSLGGHTAALEEPYADNPGTRGTMLYTQPKLNETVLKAHKAGLQVAVHAIGDRAVNAVLKAFEEALEKVPNENHRHRIEHCSVLNPKLIERMKRINAVASVQPHFAVSDFWVVSRVGEKRARWVYPFRSLVQSGIVVAAGSDCPVEPINPLAGVWAAATHPNNEEERVTVEEALAMYTVNGAYASFNENKVGLIKPGMLADFTVLSDDPCSVPPERIKDITVEMVIVGGKITYKNPKSDIEAQVYERKIE